MTGEHVHQIKDRTGTVYTMKCGTVIDVKKTPGRRTSEFGTGWHNRVTCPLCLA